MLAVALGAAVVGTTLAALGSSQVGATATGEFTVVDVAAGEDHVCAIVEFPNDDRTLYCWGVNDYGQLGIGNPSDDPTVDGDEIPGYVYAGGRPYAALPVEVLPNGDFTNTSVELISTGVRHTCVVESGTMFCWGSGNSGRLGHGLEVEEDDGNGGSQLVPDESKKYLPEKVSPVGGFSNQNVTAISVGDRHTCAIESGVVYCWGSNSSGRVGQPDGSSYSTPQVVLTGLDFDNAGIQSVAAGSGHTCALKAGAVYCWGNGGSGQIGVDPYNETDPHLPRKVSATPDFQNISVTDIGVWGSTSCAIEGAAMFCWGSGRALGAPLGDDGLPVFYTATSVNSGPDGFSNTSIESFSVAKDGNTEGAHACAIESGILYCWGGDRYGQLGNTSYEYNEDNEPLDGDGEIISPFPTQLAPVKVMNFQADGTVSTSAAQIASNSPTFMNTGVTAVSAGQSFTCAVNGGNLYCWGINDLGQLGTGDDDDVIRSVPWLVFNPSEAEVPGRPSLNLDIDLDDYIRRVEEEMSALPDTR